MNNHTFEECSIAQEHIADFAIMLSEKMPLLQAWKTALRAYAVAMLIYADQMNVSIDFDDLKKQIKDLPGTGV